MNDTQKAAVRERFERAVTNLTDLLQRDRTILAAILGGSLAHDEVWEKSDIDLMIIGDETHKEKSYTLTEEGINIHASVLPRSVFKKAVEGSIQSSFFHSYFSKSRLLYTHDESLYGLYDNIQKVGERDKAAQLLRIIPSVLWSLPKAEKWYFVKHDLRYSFLYILMCANALAQLEVVSAGQVAGREVIQHALKLNPDFFNRIYTHLIDGPKDDAAIADALAAIHGYLEARIARIFQPLLDFLAEADSPRSGSEIDLHFKKILQTDGISQVCEWLSEKGIIEKVQMPLRLSPRSQVAVNEAAYYYDGSGHHS
jgi:predicted nucleotidyltransferase